MTISHPTAVRNGIANYVVDLIDAGAGAGSLEITTASNAAVLASLDFSATAFGAAAGGTATAAAIADETNASAGTAAEFYIYDGDSTLVVQGSVGTSGEDINLSSVNIGAGDTVAISSLTYTAPA